VEIDAVNEAIIDRRTIRGLVFPHELDALLEERGMEADRERAVRIDGADPSGARARPPVEEEIAALRAHELSSVAGRFTTTERQLAEARRMNAGRRSGESLSDFPGLWDFLSGDAGDVWQRLFRDRPQFGIVSSTYRYADFEWINTYPERTMAPGRRALVAYWTGAPDDGHIGCSSEYICWTSMTYVRVLPINRDAVAELGTSPRYVNAGSVRDLTANERRELLGEEEAP
jgi:hypothetical protein